MSSELENIITLKMLSNRVNKLEQKATKIEKKEPKVEKVEKKTEKKKKQKASRRKEEKEEEDEEDAFLSTFQSLMSGTEAPSASPSGQQELEREINENERLQKEYDELSKLLTEKLTKRKKSFY